MTLIAPTLTSLICLLARLGAEKYEEELNVSQGP